MLTTRNLALVKQLGAEALAVEMLDEAAARALLKNTSKLETLPPIADELIKACGYLPLALASVGSQLAGAEKTRWIRMLQRIKEADISRFLANLPGYPYDNLFRVFQISWEDLPEPSRIPTKSPRWP